MFFKKQKRIQQLQHKLAAVECASRKSVRGLPEIIFDKDGRSYQLLIGDLGDFVYTPMNQDSR